MKQTKLCIALAHEENDKLITNKRAGTMLSHWTPVDMLGVMDFHVDHFLPQTELAMKGSNGVGKGP